MAQERRKSRRVFVFFLALSALSVGDILAVKAAPAAYPAGASDQEAWQAFTLGKQRRKLVREVIHALAGSASGE